MESRRLYLDPSAYHGNMLFLGNNDSNFRGTRSMMNLEETSKRRLFFSPPDDLYDEEYYDEQCLEKKRRLTAEQVHQLEKSFESENKLEPEKKTQLAKKLGLQPRQVAVWFQNRRARWKTKQLERDYDHLKSNYDSLRTDFDSILKENEKLKSELLSITEKLPTTEVSGAPISVQKSEPLPTKDVTNVSALQSSVKVEDRLSSGSGSSAVVDEDGPQLVDSCDSYFPNNDYPGCIAEEDDGSDDGQSYFSNVFTTTEQENQDGEALGWWVWS